MAAAPGEVAGGHPTAAEAAASGARALSARHYQSLPRALFHIARTEGIRNGLFKGLMLTWMKAPLTTAIGFTVNDKLKELLRSRRPQLEATSEALASLGATHPTAAGAAPAEGRPQPPASIYHERRAQLSSVELLAAGSLAGACAKTVIAPADRIKIIFQTDPARPFSFGQAVRRGAARAGRGAALRGAARHCGARRGTAGRGVAPRGAAPGVRRAATRCMRRRAVPRAAPSARGSVGVPARRICFFRNCFPHCSRARACDGRARATGALPARSRSRAPSSRRAAPRASPHHPSAAPCVGVDWPSARVRVRVRRCGQGRRSSTRAACWRCGAATARRWCASCRTPGSWCAHARTHTHARARARARTRRVRVGGMAMAARASRPRALAEAAADSRLRRARPHGPPRPAARRAARSTCASTSTTPA